MKAVLLAAGLGTRLKPLTDEIPKCLVPINGKPLLRYWLDAFERYGVDEVLINLHYLPQKVTKFVEAYGGPVKITLAFEPELLGSAGTVLQNREWLDNEPDFLILYADNLTNVDLREIVEYHRASGPVATVGLFETDRPQECGVVEMDGADTILRFVEKSPSPPSRMANAGIYVASQSLFDYIPATVPADFGFDVFPRMSGQLKGYRLSGYFLDIGNMERLHRAERDVPDLNF